MLGDNIENNENSGPVVEQNSIYTKTFLWMFFGLLATGIVSVFTYFKISTNLELINDIFGVMVILELVVVFAFSLLFRKLPASVVAVLYFVYAVINGISLSTIFFIYEIDSIVIVFFVSAILYLIFALIGKCTKFDLTKIGNVCLIALLGCIIVSLVNIFLQLSVVDMVIDWVVLILFFGITAYDMQQIKVMAENGILPADKLHIYGAMQLYLDFINIFLRILRLFGRRRD